MRKLIILRPEPGASASAAAACQAGLEGVSVPLFEIRPLAWTAPDPAGFDALVLTSANAARHGGEELEKLKGLPVHAVGEATAEAARGVGFDVASIGHGSGEELVGGLPRGLRLLHLAGRDHRPLSGMETLAVYDAVELPAPAELAVLSGAVVAVHSPRAGRRLAELARDKESTAVAAISAAAAAACGTGWKEVAVASQPTDRALLAVAARLCEKPGQ